MKPGETVTALIRANEARDVDAVIALLTDDVAYENVPIGVLTGHEEVRAMLGPFLGGAERVEWEVLEQVEQGEVVMNERVDRFWLPGNITIELRVAGLFKVRDGQVALWRDYFDLAVFTEQMNG
ncbi:MAG: nuclear transport factor 2 family protein [Acidimicrobiia bacterium]|nr:nuclear transport factor 2 family protein [Acidimicrobiia bacterium]